MLAITTKLVLHDASVFVAQETNVHWDAATNYQLYNQCHQAASHLQIATSTSLEAALDWYKLGGTLLLALGSWTHCIITCRSDNKFGYWSYLKFVSKQDKCIIMVSGYRVCNQKFDMASNTMYAQQMCLLQDKGH